jgi:hypothetical protein
LEEKVNLLKREYNLLRMNSLITQGIETDPIKIQVDAAKLEALRKEIRMTELKIIEVKLANK